MRILSIRVDDRVYVGHRGCVWERARKMDMNEKNKNGYSVGNCLH